VAKGWGAETWLSPVDGPGGYAFVGGHAALADTGVTDTECGLGSGGGVGGQLHALKAQRSRPEEHMGGEGQVSAFTGWLSSGVKGPRCSYLAHLGTLGLVRVLGDKLHLLTRQLISQLLSTFTCPQCRKPWLGAWGINASDPVSLLAGWAHLSQLLHCTCGTALATGASCHRFEAFAGWCPCR
jgi:hypothetical protein